MKLRSSLLLSICLLAAAPLYAQIILASWTFETNTPPDATNVAVLPDFNASLGTGVGSAVHSSTATDWTTPTDNGSANSLSANTWNVGDYYQFQVSTTGYELLSLSWSQMSTSTGPGSFKLSYSTDGITFLDFGSTYSLATATWSTGSVNAASLFSRDISALTLLNNDASIYFRLVNASTVSVGGGNVSSSGSNRLDNFTVTGFEIAPASSAALPEPSTWAGGALGLLGLCLIREIRRRKQRELA